MTAAIMRRQMTSSPTTDAVRDFITISFGASNATAELATLEPATLSVEVSHARQRSHSDQDTMVHMDRAGIA